MRKEIENDRDNKLCQSTKELFHNINSHKAFVYLTRLEPFSVGE